MSSLLANWKTSLAGLGTLAAAAGHLLTALSHGDTSTLATDLPIIIGGIGLLVAQDS